MPGKDVEKLWPHVAGKTLAFNRGKNSRHLEYFGRFGKHKDIVEECLAVDVGNPKYHLGLKVDEDDGTI